MATTTLIKGLHHIAAGPFNVYLLEAPEGLTLIDTGMPESEGKIVEGIRGVGHSERDLRHILLTHAHPDHIGSHAALKAASGARSYMHAADAPIAEAGTGFRPMTPSPELLGQVLYRVFKSADAKVPPAGIDHHVADGEVLPIAGGLQAIHVPGHCAGQLAYLWRAGGVLFAGDAFITMLGLRLPICFEDLAEGRRSLKTLGNYTYAIACTGHGKPLMADASTKVRRKWG